ncbi:MAG: hypothetical protein DYG94_07595 [Leptolyngbya sp. PLA3]|nr:MAG: hypothetical protein EDM82_10500 [Cyanobacteria bacterium CYA]MCE7968594.1 hypothetical protein [Leptolyngbya sp. PL-A3]
MLKPAPTTRIDPTLARGTLLARSPATNDRPPSVTLAFPNTHYEMTLTAVGDVKADVGKRIIGIIRAEAQRVDLVKTGGRFVEPVYGMPRRVQGSIIAADNTANTITLHAGMPVVCKLTDPRQRAVAFEPGQLVCCEIAPGATFTQKAPARDEA